MINKLVFIICLGLCTSNYATITTDEEALDVLKQHINAARKQEQKERCTALLLVQDRLLIYGMQPDRSVDFFNAVECGDIPAMQAYLKYDS